MAPFDFREVVAAARQPPWDLQGYAARRPAYAVNILPQNAHYASRIISFARWRPVNDAFLRLGCHKRLNATPATITRRSMFETPLGMAKYKG